MSSERGKLAEWLYQNHYATEGGDEGIERSARLALIELHDAVVRLKEASVEEAIDAASEEVERDERTEINVRKFLDVATGPGCDGHEWLLLLLLLSKFNLVSDEVAKRIIPFKLNEAAA